jgi:hypothetical protein
MNIINSANAKIEEVVIHKIGKPSNGENVDFSLRSFRPEKDEEALLMDYVKTAFKEPQYFKFTFAGDDFVLNPLYNYIGNIFDNIDSFYEMSIKISRLLHDKSGNPFIKSGDLFMAYVKDVIVDDELLDGVVLIKSEEKDAFLHLLDKDKVKSFEVKHGIHVEKVDKACMILNIDRDRGFKILNIDHSNKNQEAKYWREDFLVLAPMEDDFYNTNFTIKMTAEFVKKRLPAEAPLDKSTQSEYLKKTESFFNTNEKLNIADFAESVFEKKEISQQYLDFLKEKSPSAELPQSFDISDYAVKKNSRVFKSVIKLDKNFHIYVHGDHSKITKGELPDGKKYYIIYYDEEF